MKAKSNQDIVKKLLELRKIIKRKKPDFIRQDAHKKARLGFKWRKPRGKQSKMRLKKKGHRKMPTPGYGSPKLVEGLLWNGLKPVLVHNVQDLSKLDATKDIAVIAHGVGLKKKLMIVEEAEKLGIKVLYYNKEKLVQKIEEKKNKKKVKKVDEKKDSTSSKQESEVNESEQKSEQEVEEKKESKEVDKQ